MNIEIGIVGDFHNSKTQSAIADSIEHSNGQLGFTTKYRWIDTITLDNNNYNKELILSDLKITGFKDLLNEPNQTTLIK